MRSIVVTALALVAGWAGGAAAFPWQRTEQRADCARNTPLRAPYFGDLHIHTAFSADAYIFGTRGTPRDAYAFARGAATATICDENEGQTRSAHIDRPLDFAAVTDHSEWYGEVRVCTTPGSAAYDHDLCQQLRSAEATRAQEGQTTAHILVTAGVPWSFIPAERDFCAHTPGLDCHAATVSVWQDIQAAAEEAYDRTDACTFTSFVAFE